MKTVIALALLCAVVAQAYPGKRAFPELEKRLSTNFRSQLLDKLEAALQNGVEKKATPSGRTEKIGRTIARQMKRDEGDGGSNNGNGGSNNGNGGSNNGNGGGSNGGGNGDGGSNGAGEHTGGFACDEDYRHELALASMGLTEFAGHVEEINLGWWLCSYELGGNDPLFTEEELEDRYAVAFDKITHTDKPIVEALDQKTQLFMEGFDRFHERIATGVVEQTCLDESFLVQYGIASGVLTLYVEAFITGHDDLLKWTNDNFGELIEESWANGTLLKIFMWIEKTFGGHEATEAGP